uniref:Dolichyl-diphosphooligosaccharide--protein glycosyltransferase subunit 2 n=1 Tax=Ciona intestinalis TaxID=7719 RepID=F6S3Q7_CIOIN
VINICLYRSISTLLALVGIANAVQLDSVLTTENSKQLISKFKAPYKTLEDAHYSIVGLKSYQQGGAVASAEKEAACKLVKTVDTKSLTSIFYAATTQAEIPACKHEFNSETLEFVKGKISETSDVKTIYEAVSILKSLGKAVDSDEVISVLLAAVKADNSVLASSLALLTASQLSKPNLSSLLKSVDVEDMAAQADELSERYLHFDNDLAVTATFLSAAISLPAKSLPISNDQVILFSNFVLRHKNSVSSIKEASLLVSALAKVASASQIAVGKAQLISGTSLSEANPSIKVSILNVFGQPIPNLSVKAESIIRASDNEVLLSNAAFKVDENMNYQLLFWKNKPKSGFYDVTLAASSPKATLVGVSEVEFRVKITTKMALTNLEIGTAEKDQVTPTLNSLKYGGKTESMSADTQQRIIMKFQVQDTTDKSLITPHQAFVRFVSSTGQEIIFVAEHDKTLTYKFEIDLATAGREQFNSASGKYSMHLIVGDATISNPVFWKFGDINLKLGEAKKSKSSFESHYSAKPEIQHTFRLPEERPPVFVSQAFTVACLLPIVLLFIFWAKVGANLGKLKLAPKNIIFHAGLIGIFVLYYFCWKSLDMFTTVQYLFGVGAVTFVFGNSVLSDIANNR